ncbi:MAG: methionyl-tRNA formyltransferase [Armatimonas sp.]
MRVVFFGTSPFAVPTLRALAESEHDLLAVVTQPDRPSGRGMSLTPSAVKKAAEPLGLPILQPERVRRNPFPAELAALAPDVLVVVSFGQIIPQKVLDIPKFGGINVHASLLPRWRGAAPIHWAIIEGDAQTGVATMQMEATLDTGPVFLEHIEPIGPNDTPEILEPRLAEAGATLLIDTLARLAQEPDWQPTPQATAGETYASMIDRTTGLIDPLAQSAAQIERRIRALSPRPGVHVALADREVKLLSASVEPGDGSLGTVLSVGKDGIRIGTTDGVLCITRLQSPGKPAMDAWTWQNGARLQPGDKASILPSNSEG